MPSQKRHCIIDPQGGEVSLQLKVNNGIRAGAGFNLLLKEDNSIKEQWRMKTGDDGSDEYVLKLNTKELSNCGITWEILCCSLIPAVESGRAEIVVKQDNDLLPMTKLAAWNISDVPNCSDNKTVSIKSVLIFASE